MPTLYMAISWCWKLHNDGLERNSQMQRCIQSGLNRSRLNSLMAHLKDPSAKALYAKGAESGTALRALHLPLEENNGNTWLKMNIKYLFKRKASDCLQRDSSVIQLSSQTTNMSHIGVMIQMECKIFSQLVFITISTILLCSVFKWWRLGSGPVSLLSRLWKWKHHEKTVFTMEIREHWLLQNGPRDLSNYEGAGQKHQDPMGSVGWQKTQEVRNLSWLSQDVNKTGCRTGQCIHANCKATVNWIQVILAALS